MAHYRPLRDYKDYESLETERRPILNSLFRRYTLNNIYPDYASWPTADIATKLWNTRCIITQNDAAHAVDDDDDDNESVASLPDLEPMSDDDDDDDDVLIGPMPPLGLPPLEVLIGMGSATGFFGIQLITALLITAAYHALPTGDALTLLPENVFNTRALIERCPSRDLAPMDLIIVPAVSVPPPTGFTMTALAGADTFCVLQIMATSLNGLALIVRFVGFHGDATSPSTVAFVDALGDTLSQPSFNLRAPSMVIVPSPTLRRQIAPMVAALNTHPIPGVIAPAPLGYLAPPMLFAPVSAAAKNQQSRILNATGVYDDLVLSDSLFYPGHMRPLGEHGLPPASQLNKLRTHEILRAAVHDGRTGFEATMAPILTEAQLDGLGFLHFNAGPNFGLAYDEKNICTLEAFAPHDSIGLSSDPMYHFPAVLRNFARASANLFGPRFPSCLEYAEADIATLCGYKNNSLFLVPDIYEIVNKTISTMARSSLSEAWQHLNSDERALRRCAAMRITLTSPVVQEWLALHEFERMIAAVAASASAAPASNSAANARAHRAFTSSSSRPPPPRVSVNFSAGASAGFGAAPSRSTLHRTPTGSTGASNSAPARGQRPASTHTDPKRARAPRYAYDLATEPPCHGAKPCRAWLNNHGPCFTSATCLHATTQRNGRPCFARPHAFDAAMSPTERDAYRRWASIEA
jgi:hypothetical protein